MNLIDAYDKYCYENTISTVHTHSKKIKEYINNLGNIDLKDAFGEMNLNSYIFSGDQTAKGKYDALISFYKFVYTKILNIPKKNLSFPISQKEAADYDHEHGPYDLNSRNNRGNRIFLPVDFSFDALFSDEYYGHLNNAIAIITVKAAIALAIGAGYDSGDMFYNNYQPKMKLTDPLINDSVVKVKNYSENSTIQYIEIKGKLAQYIRDYYKIRIESRNIALKEEGLFFAKMWDGKHMDHDATIEKSKPYSVQLLVYYILKYISKAKELENNLTVTDLRSNLILHSLYNTKGSSLKQIMRVFGYLPFVEEAFKKYCENDMDDSCSIFSDPDFFLSSPSEMNNESDGPDGESKKAESVISRILRDHKKVTELKTKYQNVCQICGEPLMLINNISYSEGCHIQPLGSNHKGIDDEENMLILCPNHHKLFDMGFLCIDPDNMKRTLYVDINNPLNNRPITLLHKLSPICVRYHYENIFVPIKKEILNLYSNS